MAAGDVAEIERGASGTPHSLHAHHVRFPKAEVVAAALAPVVWKAGADQRKLERGRIAHVNRLAVETRALAAPGDEAQLLERVEDHAHHHRAALLVCDRSTELRIAVGEVGSAVERIDDPS